MPCAKGCCVDKTVVVEKGDLWIIKRKLAFKRLDTFQKSEPEFPDILITPGQDPDDPLNIIPVEITLPKSHGDLDTVLKEVLPNIVAKENDCKVCKEAKEFLQRLKDKATS